MARLADAIAPKSTHPAHTATIWTFDIERFPMTTYQWGARNRSGYTGEHMVTEYGRISSWAAKRHDGIVLYADEHTHGRADMIRSLHEVMRSADILVGFNSINFDLPHCNTEFLLEGLTPPPPVKHIDLMRVIKRRFRLEYNNLGSITKRLGIPTKIDTGGFDMWRRMMDGDPEAWAANRRYNIQDVHVTDALRQRLAGWNMNGPNLGLWMGGDRTCWNCASENLVRDGSSATNVTRYARYQCGDCGAWNRDKHRMASVDLRQAL